MPLTLWILLSAAVLVTATPAASEPIRSFPCPDPSILADAKGRVYFIVCTGRGIPLWFSRDLKRWQRVGRIFREDVPEWARQKVPTARTIWAPDLKRVGNRYYIYYSVSTLFQQRSVIGLVIGTSLDPEQPSFRWHDVGQVVESRPGDAFNAIDPALLVTPSGEGYLFWGSFWDGIKAAPVSLETGKLLIPARQAKAVARRVPPAPPAIEGAYPIYREGWYYLFVSWDYTFAGDPQEATYKIVVGRSRHPLGPYVDRLGVPMTRGGGELVLMSTRRWRGTGHNSVLITETGSWLVYHAIDARNPRAGRLLQVRQLRWIDGWPVAGPLVLPSTSDRPTTPQDHIVGRWTHVQPDGRRVDIFLEPSGLISGVRTVARWRLLAPGRLELRWPSNQAPGGAWVDRVRLIGHERYEGTNQLGHPVRGWRRSCAVPGLQSR